MKTETDGRLLYLQITNYRPRKLPPDILSLLRGEHPPIFLTKPIEFLVLFQADSSYRSTSRFILPRAI